MNRRLVEEHGGAGVGFVNPGSLEFALEEIQGTCFGRDICPTVFDKAATLGWRIIRGHVFTDANKRTGMMTTLLFLRLNGVEVSADGPALIRTGLAIAEGVMGIAEFAHFLREHSRNPV